MCSPVLLLPFIAPSLILPFDTLLKCTPSLLLCSTGAHSRRSIAICSWCRGADNSLFYLSLSSTKGPGHWSNASRLMAAQQAAFCTLLRGWREEGRIQQWLKIQGLYWQTYTQKIQKIWFSKFLLHYELKMAVVTSYVQLFKKKQGGSCFTAGVRPLVYRFYQTEMWWQVGNEFPVKFMLPRVCMIWQFTLPIKLMTVSSVAPVYY